jgi:hypothetical protein
MSLLVTLNGLRLLRGRSHAHDPDADGEPVTPCADGCCSHE